MSQVLSNLAFIRAIQNTVILQPGESSPVLQMSCAYHIDCSV